MPPGIISKYNFNCVTTVKPTYHFQFPKLIKRHTHTKKLKVKQCLFVIRTIRYGIKMVRSKHVVPIDDKKQPQRVYRPTLNVLPSKSV